jgi:hypothetical protein
MKKNQYYEIFTATVLLILFVNTTVFAEEYASYFHVQAMLGRMSLDEGDYIFEGDPGADDSFMFEGDSVDIPMIGASVQQILGGDRFEFGVEGGGLFSWKSDDWQVVVSDGVTRIHIDNDMFLADLFLGGFVARDIGKRLRLYLGAGPLIIYGHQKIDPDDPHVEPYASYEKETESDWDVGLYIRVGIEFRFTDKLIAGLGVRWIETQLDFNNPGGKTEVEGTQVMFTLGITVPSGDMF